MNDVFQSANPVTAPFGDGVRTAAAGAEGSLEASFHFFEAGGGLHVLVVDGSQIYAIDDELRLAINGAVVGGPAKIRALLADLGIEQTCFLGDAPLDAPPVRALSLAVAERCNLGCTYCYAEQGAFGGPGRSMAWQVAKASVRRLFAESKAGERVNLAFLGGEPLVNRKVIQRATRIAARIADRRRVPIGFSITTNGTLLTPDDGTFFEHYGFAVTVSLDGVGAVHDALRPTKAGAGTYARVIANTRPLLAMQKRMQISARVTVTPANLDLRRTLDEFVALGFHSVGFSPVLRSPTGRGQMELPDLEVLLAQMIDCGRELSATPSPANATPSPI